MTVKKDAAAKGLTISSQMLNFMLGLGIVIIIMFALLFYFFRNAYERVAEQQVANLYKRINEVCENGEPQRMNFVLPQGLLFEDYLKKKIMMTTNVLVEPYFYVYYEKFPPEPPYQLFEGPLETAEALVIPWSEDLPWSSNLLLTAALDLTSFNHIPGFESLKDKLTQQKRMILDSNKLRPLIKAGQITNDVQKVVLGNKKVLAGVLVGGTLMCKMATDYSLEACAGITAVSYFTVRIAGKLVKIAWNDGIDFIKAKRISFKFNALDEHAQKLAQNGERVTLEALQEEIEYGGKKIKFIDHLDSQGRGVVTRGDHWDALEAWWIQEGQPENIGAFTFEKESTTGKLKDIFMEKTRLEGPWTKFKDSLNTLKGAIGKITGSDVLAPDGMELAANSMEVSVKKDWKTWSNIIKNARKELVDLKIDPNDKKQVEEFVLKAAKRLREKSQAGYITLIEKDSGLAQYLLLGSSDSVQMTKFFLEDFDNAAKNSQEAKRLINWMAGKELRIGEKMKPLAQGTLGYTILRIQDMYTPLGVTYWDKTLSVYNDPVSACRDDQLCLQYGLFVRKWDLIPVISSNISYYPITKSCDVKLVRDSIVAKDPRFYLVSPCFAKLEITRRGDTVYVNPYLCRNPPAEYADNPNYCFANSGYVNFYVTSEGAAFAADCIATAACSIAQAVGTAGATAPISVSDITAKCFGFKQIAPKGVCSWLGSGIRLAFDLNRESIASYPYVPDYVRNWLGADSNRYVDC